MDVIVVLPNTTSETLGALNSMVPGGTNHFDNLLLLYNLSLIHWVYIAMQKH